MPCQPRSSSPTSLNHSCLLTSYPNSSSSCSKQIVPLPHAHPSLKQSPGGKVFRASTAVPTRTPSSPTKHFCVLTRSPFHPSLNSAIIYAGLVKIRNVAKPITTRSALSPHSALNSQLNMHRIQRILRTEFPGSVD